MAYGIELLIALVMMVVSYAISYTLMPRPERNDAVAGNMEVPTAEAGKNIPVIFGTILIKDTNVIDYFDPQIDAIKRGGGGGK